VTPDEDNIEHAHRHAWNALSDFEALRRNRHWLDPKLLNSISHHLRHAVYRTGLEIPRKARHYARRRRGS
jgi:hypothetical protein